MRLTGVVKRTMFHSAMSDLGNIPTSGEGELPAKFVHELGNLLDGSLRSVSLALRRAGELECDGHGAVAESLKSADAALRQMAGLIRGYQRGGDTAIAPCPTATLGGVIDQAVAVLAGEARRRGIDLSVLVGDEVRAIRAGRLYPVIANAVRNAIEAIDAGGCVWIEAEADNEGGGTLALRISDDGPGLDEGLFRDRDGVVLAGQSTKSTGEHRGLGLAICRDAVRAAGGMMRMEDRDGGGTSVIVRVPMHTKVTDAP